MKTGLEPQDIEEIARRVVDILKPLLSGKGKSRNYHIIYDVQGLADNSYA